MPDSTHHYDPSRGPRDRGLRASDGDRDAVTEILRAEHVAGRLDHEEFQERLERCLSAKRYADLDALISDLPLEAGAPAPRRLPRRLSGAAAALAIVAAVIIVSHGHAIWLAIPAFFFVARPLLWGGAGSGHRKLRGCAATPARRRHLRAAPPRGPAPAL